MIRLKMHLEKIDCIKLGWLEMFDENLGKFTDRYANLNDSFARGKL